jgi:hypothetical protein
MNKGEPSAVGGLRLEAKKLKAESSKVKAGRIILNY